MGIIAILFGFVSINLIRLQRHSSLTTTVDTLVSDLYSQQNKTMTLDTEGRGTNDDYGIYFETSRYTLFHGPSYPPLDASNFIINLDPSLTFSSITFPSSSVIFSKGSGEVSGFIDGSNTITLTDSTNGEQKIIQLNRYGAITVQ